MYQIYLDFAKKIAYKAKEIMLKYFEKDNNISYKLDNTIITIADKEINKYLIDEVKTSFSDHSVDGEEESFGNSKYTWVCDPIDGTAMYARNIPTAVFSLALVEDGIPIIGVIYDPFNDNMYSAIKGQGAYKNDIKISVNNYNLNDIESVAHYDMWPSSKYNIYDVVKELNKKTYLVSIGSIARACMCVAEGNFTVAIFPGNEHKNCDVAAAKIIVEEAGGKITDLFGDDQRYDQDINGAVISNQKVHEEVIETIKRHLIKGE